MMDMTALIDDRYHAPLLRKWPTVADRANIAEHWLDKSATKFCSDEVCAWIRTLPALMREQKAGLKLRTKQHSPEDRCSVIAAAVLRNYTDAKVMPLRELFSKQKSGVPDVTVLLIPDFFKEGESLAEWQVQYLLGVLTTRHLKGRATVVYVEDMDSMGKVYGEAIYEHIKRHYTAE